METLELFRDYHRVLTGGYKIAEAVDRFIEMMELDPSVLDVLERRIEAKKAAKS